MALNPVLVLDVVGMTPSLLAHAPNLRRLAEQGTMRTLRTVTPAVTTTVQSTLLTGTLPREHGIVANGWYFRELAEVLFWRQSNALVQGEKLWETGRRLDPAFTCAKLFWWYNMYASVDFAVTPRPMYPADGRKLPDIHTHPAELRDELQA
jgi:predicted AlkP superfamily pyrophosphatase or phosphodiesterase